MNTEATIFAVILGDNVFHAIAPVKVDGRQQFMVIENGQGQGRHEIRENTGLRNLGAGQELGQAAGEELDAALFQVVEDELLTGFDPDPADKTVFLAQGLEQAVQGVVIRDKLHGRQKSISTKR